MKRIAVVAGTPVDNQMGVDYLNKKNEEAGTAVCQAIYLPVSESCNAQRAFQYGSEEKKREVLDALFDAECANGRRLSKWQ